MISNGNHAVPPVMYIPETINSIQCDLNWPSKLCKPQFSLNALRINGQKILRGNDLESFFLPVLVQLLILHVTGVCCACTELYAP